MIYNKLYAFLKEIAKYDQAIIPVDEISEIHNFGFDSLYYDVLSGNETYYCKKHIQSFNCNDFKN